MCKEGMQYYKNGIRTSCNSIKCRNLSCRKEYCEKEFIAMSVGCRDDPPNYFINLNVNLGLNEFDDFLERKYMFLLRLSQFKYRTERKGIEFEYYWNFEIGEVEKKPHLNLLVRSNPDFPLEKIMRWAGMAWKRLFNHWTTRISATELDSAVAGERYVTKCLRNHVPERFPDEVCEEKFRTNGSSSGFFLGKKVDALKFANAEKWQRIREAELRSFEPKKSFCSPFLSKHLPGWSCWSFKNRFIGTISVRVRQRLTPAWKAAYKLKKQALGWVSRFVSIAGDFWTSYFEGLLLPPAFLVLLGVSVAILIWFFLILRMVL
jgi:hypothetical protein